MMVDEKGRCGRCREWQEHYYWEHMEDVSKISFFKLMTGDFQQRISIPEKIANNFIGKIANGGFTLKAPSGEEWRVGVEKIADKRFFMPGWEEFAMAHELQENELLLFKCSGNCSFDVLIFDASGCEKVSCFFANKKGINMRKQFDNIVSQHGQEHCILSDSDDTSMPLSQLVRSTHKASTSKKPSKANCLQCVLATWKENGSPNSSNYYLKNEVEQEEESDDDHTESNNYYYSRIANCLSEDEREEIFRQISIQSGNPVYVVVLQKAHVRPANNLLIISSKFAADHLEGRSYEMLLLRPNRKEKWCLKYYHSRVTRGFNSRRWNKFVRDNMLREGYVCIFELMKGARKATMTVHVLRKVDDKFVLLG
ncbi:B3 domain-containing protein Os12g0592300-like [Triticum urartu]|uniref:B3 domain-containing protein Os12g0592300-like n=1 Tax=Triticum urartu TaxID=4572 RepID=UPI0020438881|nr:B3 domain-containing protein Os12g0592300-like [Triticum urartu]